MWTHDTQLNSQHRGILTEVFTKEGVVSLPNLGLQLKGSWTSLHFKFHVYHFNFYVINNTIIPWGDTGECSPFTEHQ